LSRLVHFATSTSAVWPGLTQSLSLQGCTGAAESPQASTRIPRTQETAARGAAHVASLVDYAGRALDADSGGLARQARANRQQCRAKLLTDQRFRYFGTNPSRILSECETSDCLG
jgi:hypothetical protein